MSIEGFDDLMEGELRFFRSRTTGPGVMLMHELPGLTPVCIKLAKRLAEEEGFRIYLPLLFGQPGDDAGRTNLARVCLSREFRVFASAKSSPITKKLRQLGQRMLTEGRGSYIGVIGMCLTGGFVLSMLADQGVVAGVSCQPSLPLIPWLGRARAFGVVQTELEAVKANSRARVLGLRFSRDGKCPPQRLEAMKDLLPGRVRVIEIPANDSSSHSTLTRDYREGNHRQHFDEVVGFLRSSLEPSRTNT